MCLLCVQIQKDKLSVKEIANNFREMSEEDNHWIDVVEEIRKKGLVDEVGEELTKVRK